MKTPIYYEMAFVGSPVMKKVLIGYEENDIFQQSPNRTRPGRCYDDLIKHLKED